MKISIAVQVQDNKFEVQDTVDIPNPERIPFYFYQKFITFTQRLNRFQRENLHSLYGRFSRDQHFCAFEATIAGNTYQFHKQYGNTDASISLCEHQLSAIQVQDDVAVSYLSLEKRLLEKDIRKGISDNEFDSVRVLHQNGLLFSFTCHRSKGSLSSSALECIKTDIHQTVFDTTKAKSRL